MRRTFTLSFFFGAALALCVSAFAGQCGHHGCGNCACGTDGCRCDCGYHAMGGGCCQSGSMTRTRAKEALQEGKIAEINYLPGLTPEDATVQVRLLADAKASLIRLAPIGFLHENELELKEGDTLSVIGYWASTIDGHQFIAMRITKQGKSLSLRDAQGNPLW